MIFRTGIRCPGCSRPVRVRISISPSDGTPFYFPCPLCQTIVTGEMRGRRPGTHEVIFCNSEELPGGADPDGVVTIDPNLPLRRDSMRLGEKGGAPGATLAGLLGPDNLPRFMVTSGRFRGFREHAWPKHQRWYEFYLHQQWDHFDRVTREEYGVNWSQPRSQGDRDSYAYRVLSLGLAECTTAGDASDANFFGELADKLDVALEIEEYQAYAGAVTSDVDIDQEQKRLWDCIRLFMRLSDSWLPGLIFDLVSDNPRVDPQDLHLCRDEFHQLRDMYISCFEACCKTLIYLVELQNTVARGRPDAFSTQLPAALQGTGKRPPTTRRQFEKLTNHDKLCYLEDWQSLTPRLSTILDNKLRNALGHNSIRHDLHSGDIVDDAGFRLPYFEFCAKVYHLASALQVASFAVHNVKVTANEKVAPL